MKKTTVILWTIILCLLASRVWPATILVTPAEGIQHAVNRAVNGDTLIVGAGSFGGVDFRGRNLIIEGAGTVSTILTGQVWGGAGVIRKLTVANARPSLIDGALMPGSNSLIEDVDVRDNLTIGVGLRSVQNVTLRRVRIFRNGTLGMNAGQATTQCDNLTFEQIEVFENNNGRTDLPIITGKTYRASDGKIYREAFDEGGGAKLTRTLKGTVKNSKFYRNGGPGLWFDVQGNNFQVIDCEFYDNHNSPDRPAYEGTGTAAEIGEYVTWTNCYGHGNSGSAFAFWESPNCKMISCVLDNDGVEFRNLGRGYPLKNILVDGTRLYNGARIQQLDPAFLSANNIVVKNTVNITGVPAWTPSGSAPPPPPPPPSTLPTTQPAPRKVVDVTVRFDDGTSTVTRP